MAVQSSFYSGTALETRTFPSTKHIATKAHMAVWRQQVSDDVWVQMDTSEYQLINNACVLNQLLSTATYDQLEVRVADAPDELTTTPSDIATVAGLANEITTVAGIEADVQAVAANPNLIIGDALAASNNLSDVADAPTALANLGAEPADATILKDADIGVTLQAYDVDTAKTDTTQNYTAPQRSADTTDNDGSFDCAVANNFSCTPTATFALTFTNIPADEQSGTILLDNSGGHVVTADTATKVDANFLSTVSTAGVYIIGYRTKDTVVYCYNTGALS